MKKLLYAGLFLALLTTCKDNTQKAPELKPIEVQPDQTLTEYPKELILVFDAHGGLDTWNEMETLEFSVEKPGGYEITTTDLKDRYALIEMPEHTIGFDGDSIWLKNRSEHSFKGSPETYYNYMFQLYAMPFVVGDESATYQNVPDLNYDGKRYPGLQVIFNHHGTTLMEGATIYYDPESYKMVWLAYGNDPFDQTPTLHFIHYGKWQEVEGLLLPETMTWYTAQNDRPGTKEKEVTIVSPMLTTVKMDMRVFAKPEEAVLVQ